MWIRGWLRLTSGKRLLVHKMTWRVRMWSLIPDDRRKGKVGKGQRKSQVSQGEEGPQCQIWERKGEGPARGCCGSEEDHPVETEGGGRRHQILHWSVGDVFHLLLYGPECGFNSHPNNYTPSFLAFPFTIKSQITYTLTLRLKNISICNACVVLASVYLACISMGMLASLQTKNEMTGNWAIRKLLSCWEYIRRSSVVISKVKMIQQDGSRPDLTMWAPSPGFSWWKGRTNFHKLSPGLLRHIMAHPCMTVTHTER